jgi:hypothetical protein
VCGGEVLGYICVYLYIYIYIYTYIQYNIIVIYFS